LLGPPRPTRPRPGRAEPRHPLARRVSERWRVPPPHSPPQSRSHHAVARGPPTVVVRVAADLFGPSTALRHSWVTATLAIVGSYVHQGKRPMVFGTVGNGQ